ncbi:MAG: hypothetical protein RL726_1247 [Actinomycetota bacterium]|jgi:hypothetical protein
MNSGVVLIVLGVVFVIAAIVAFGVEPHWSSRDGRHFVARAAHFERDGSPSWVEVRGSVDHGSILITARRRRHSHLDGTYHLARTGESSRRTTVAFLRGNQDVLLRLPRHSRTLRAMTTTSDPEATSSG